MFSVIIPALNEEKYLARTIASVRAQLIPHEVVVVCNGCTDNTEALARKLADKVLVLKERGVSRARNEGVRVASFGWLVFLDADTLLSPHVFEKVRDVGGYGTARAAANSGKVKDSLFFLIKFVTQFAYSSTGMVYCSREVFNQVGGFREDLDKFEDGTFLRSARKFAKFHVLWTPVFTSTRRYQKKGYLGITWFWIREFFSPSGKKYEVVR